MNKTNEDNRPTDRPTTEENPSEGDSLVTSGGPGSGPPEPYWENLLKCLGLKPQGPFQRL